MSEHSDDEQKGWMITIEEMEPDDVHGFKEHLSKLGVPLPTVYTYSNRLDWMQIMEWRGYLTTYCAKLWAKHNTNGKLASSHSETGASSDDDENWSPPTRSVSRAASSRSSQSSVQRPVSVLSSNRFEPIEIRSDELSGSNFEIVTETVRIKEEPLTLSAYSVTRNTDPTPSTISSRKRFIPSEDDASDVGVGKRRTRQTKERKVVSPDISELEESDGEVDEVARGVVKKRIGKETRRGKVRGEDGQDVNGEVRKYGGQLKKGKEWFGSKKMLGHEAWDKADRSGGGKRTHRESGSPEGVLDAQGKEGSYTDTENEGPIRSTSQTHVDRISTFKEPLARYPIAPSGEEIGYLFDLSESEPAISHPTHSMDKILRSAVRLIDLSNHLEPVS